MHQLWKDCQLAAEARHCSDSALAALEPPYCGLLETNNRAADEIAAADFQDNQAVGPAYPLLGSGLETRPGPDETLQALHPAACSGRMDSSAVLRRVEELRVDQAAHLQDQAALFQVEAHLRPDMVAVARHSKDKVAVAKALAAQV